MIKKGPRAHLFDVNKDFVEEYSVSETIPPTY